MKLLFILDWTLFLPVTLTRLGIIYFEGSRYNIEGLKFLDVMMHSENKYFNQNEDLEPTIDTTTEDVRKIIKYDSHLYEMTEIKNNLINKLLKDDIELNTEIKENNEKNINFKSSSNNLLYYDESPKHLSETQSESKSDSQSQSHSDSESQSYKLYDNEEEPVELKNKYDLDFLIKSAKDKINVIMNK